MRIAYLLPALFLFSSFHACSSNERTAVNPDIIELSALGDFTLPGKPDYAPPTDTTIKTP
jgi:hypothetical protein